MPVNAANTAYEEAYISMLQGDDDSCSIHCDTYYATVDTLTPVEVLSVQTTTDLEDGENTLRSTAEGYWTSLEANVAELEPTADTLFEDVYQPEPIWQRPVGHAAKGIDAFKVLCHVNCLKEAAAIVVGDSGAALTLISEQFLKGLKWSKPKPRTGKKLELIQLTGSAGCSEYVRLKLYFRSQFGPICLKGVEAYVVKNMTTNLLIGEDTQLAWQLNSIRNNGKRFWQVGTSAHQIPTIAGPTPKESFSVQWNPNKFEYKQRIKKRATKTRSEWSVIAKQDVWLRPESITSIPITSTGAPTKENMFLEAIPLDRGGDSFISAPHGLVILDETNSSLIKMANTTNRTVLLRSGELIGRISRAEDSLKKINQASKAELDLFTTRAAQLAALVPILNAKPMTPEVNNVGLRTAEEVQTSEHEETNWGPKTTDPGPDQIYPSDKLRETIDVDPELTSAQREALYKIVEDNQAAFGFDGRLGHYKTKVHIELVPGTKPISAPPYHASPAKREAIDKQIDLWLTQDVIEESKSPWGAPVIIVYRNNKPRMCIDYRKMNKATIADQHPIPKQTDILAALSGAQYLSVFDALSGFTQLEFDEESRPISAFRTHRGLHQFKRMPFGWRNGPPEFQRVMQEVLAPYLWVFTLVYIDDIVVYSRTFEDHLKHVELVLKAVANSKITLSPPKCHLGYRSIIVLGNKVSRLGLSTHHEKLKAVWELEAPHDRKKLESFLGLAVYFSSYIPYFSWMANPLFKCLRQKESPFSWTDELQNCFQLIKSALASAPVRGHPEAGQAYRLYTDASDYAIAGALQQVQYMAIKDLKGTRAYKKMQAAHLKKDKVPDLTIKLSKEFDDKRPLPNWATSWEETLVPVERVVAYWSRVLHSAETRYSATEREALAAKEALVRFQPLIEGERVLLVTDHSALTWAKTYENANRRLAAWGLVFAAFPDLAIIHRPGRVHSNVDPLSRLPRVPEFVSPAREDLPSQTLSTEHEELQQLWHDFIKERELKADSYAVTAQAPPRRLSKSKGPSSQSIGRIATVPSNLHVHASQEFVLKFVEGYKNDKDFAPLITCTLEEPQDARKFRAYRIGNNGLLYFEDADHKARLCVPAVERANLIKEVHDCAHESAHAGWERTLAALRDRFYWPRMRSDVTDYVRSCDPCQKIKHDRGSGVGYLQPLEIPTNPYDHLTLDFITGLPLSHNKDAILVVVDKLTKYAHFIATTAEVTAEESAILLFKRVIKFFGMPSRIIGDRDPRWTSAVWKSLALLFGTRLALSTSKHPQTDGQTEVMNQHLETMLRAYVQKDQADWSEWLDILQFAYNNATHSAHKSKPAELLLGYKPRSPLDFLKEHGLTVLEGQHSLRSRLMDLVAHREAARDAIQRSADRQAFQYDKGRRAPQLDLGDEVLINPHALELIETKGKGRKLIQRKIGPFEITEVVSPTAFRLRLPDSYPMHNVVNIRHLTKYHRSPDKQRPTLTNPRDLLKSSEEYEVEKIVGEKRSKGKSFYKVRWKGYDAENDTWQSARDLRNAPELLKEWKAQL
ncbi:MAG TPA: reverse transcriptase domain-containing protein [Candidatus Bathyarchaeia archaeon]